MNEQQRNMMRDVAEVLERYKDAEGVGYHLSYGIHRKPGENGVMHASHNGTATLTVHVNGGAKDTEQSIPDEMMSQMPPHLRK